jgi:4'-phosphopantetheinyl transferase
MKPVTDQVTLVEIPLDVPAIAVRLDDSERRRADRFVFEHDNRRFVAAHTALRVVLGRRLGLDPADVRIVAGERGKPRLEAPPIDVRFNLSHSGERALLAIATGREVGVDIERTRPRPDPLALAERWFSLAERAHLRQVRDEDLHEMFYRVWTRKESFVKALGDGMHFPLDGFDVSGEEDGPQLLLACRAAPHELDRWTTRTAPCEPAYAAAITVEGGAFDLVSVAYRP